MATIGVTVKSVNHRFLDLQLRVPPSYAGLEARIRSLAQARLSRGRVEISLTVQTRRTPALEVELNETFLEALGGALDHARERGYIAGPMSPGDLLRFPQALAVRERAQEPTADEQLLPRIEEAISAAIDSLDTMRIKEGEFLRADLDARREQLGQLFEQAYAASESGMDALRARLEERVKTLRADALAEETAIAQEIAKFVARSDITEEVVRFRGHLEHWTSLTDAPEPCGRKLDFLLQEMNREVNTVGSKAEGATVSEVVVNLKAELEKMREQVQNVE
jgi:uncharacterized protein (TIGR00255 family)